MQTITARDVGLLLVHSGKVMESAGKNRGPEIDEINGILGMEMGAPYCTSGQSVCFLAVQRPKMVLKHPHLAEILKPISEGLLSQTVVGNAFPVSGSSQGCMRSFRARDRVFTDPQKLLACEGAMGFWTNPDGEHGHFFGIDQRFTDNGRVVAIGTWEFNTSPMTKDRDGEGAYCLKRTIVELDVHHPRFGFIDVSDIAGGKWWPK